MKTTNHLTTESKALLWAGILQIEQNPKLWDQAEWTKETECGTAYCYGGHVACLSGKSGWSEGKTVTEVLLNLGLNAQTIDFVTYERRTFPEIKAAILLICYDLLPMKNKVPTSTNIRHTYERIIGPLPSMLLLPLAWPVNIINHLKHPPEDVRDGAIKILQRKELTDVP